MRHPTLIALVSTLIVLGLLTGRAQGQTVTEGLVANYLVDTWESRDAPHLTHYNGIFPAPDGSVWFTSFDGVARFDGARFESFRMSTVDGLPTNRWISVAFDDDGSVWLSSEFGDLVHMRDGEIRVWPAGSVFPTRVTQLTRIDGEIWFHSSAIGRIVDGEPVVVSAAPVTDVRGFVALDDSRFLVADQGLFEMDHSGEFTTVFESDQPFARIHTDSAGRLWAVGQDQIVTRDTDGQWREVEHECARIGEPVFELVLAPPNPNANTLFWSQIPSAWWSLEDDGRIHCLKSTTDTGVGPGLIDDEGVVWTLRDGFLRADDEPVFVLDSFSYRIERDQANQIWVAGAGGALFRVRRRLAEAPDVGEFVTPAYHVSRAADGGVWVSGMAHVALRHFDESARPDRVAETPVHEGEELPMVYGSIARRDGSQLVATSAGLCSVQRSEGITPNLLDDSSRRASCELWYTPPASASVFSGVAVMETRNGELWMSCSEGIATDIAPGQSPRWVHRLEGNSPRLGRVVSMSELPDGRVLAAGNTGLIIMDEHGTSSFHHRVGSPGIPAALRALQPSADFVWVGTSGAGLCRLRPDAIEETRCISVAEGLPYDSVLGVLLDEEGWLWMSSPRGVFAAPESALIDVLEGRTERVAPIRVNEHHGMPDLAALSSDLTIDGQGRLWVPTVGGPTRIDPRPLRAAHPPTPRIEEIRSALSNDVLDAARLPSTSQDVIFSWNVADPRWGDQLVFRYRLNDSHTEWAYTTDRSVRIHHLPARTSTLEVQAGLAGAWSESSRLEVFRQPRFGESPWFPAAIAAIVLLLTGAIAGVRERSHEHSSRELQRAVDAKTVELARRNAVLAESQRELARRNDEVTAQSRQLQELAGVKARFISHVGHELRTPITLILGALDAMAPESMDEDAWVDLAERNAEHLAGLIEQLMDIARLDEAQMPVRPVLHDLDEHIGDVVTRLSRLRFDDGIVVAFSSKRPVLADADPNLIDKVVANLISNALKHSPQGGTVSVTLEGPTGRGLRGGFATVIVRDEGPGIPREDRERIFERFVQLEATQNRAADGLGIGLALAMEIAELMGGGLTVSDAPTGGAEFCFTIPVDAAERAPHTPVRHTAAPKGPEPPMPAEHLPLLLVCDDHPDMRSYLTRRLSTHFRVVEASDGEDGLDQVRRHNPDVVIADVMMPRLDGIGFCRALRQMPGQSETPVLLLTAKAELDDRLTGLSVADDYVTKPFDPREVLARLYNLLGVHFDPDSKDLDVDARPRAERDIEARLDAIVTAHAADPDFAVTTLAHSMAMSERQLRRTVKRVTGLSPNAYIRSVRLRIANTLIRQGIVSSVAEAAEAVGWTPNHFSRLYGEAYGESPSTRLTRNRRGEDSP